MPKNFNLLNAPSPARAIHIEYGIRRARLAARRGHGLGRNRRIERTRRAAGLAALLRRSEAVIYLFQSGAPSRWICSITSRSWRNGAAHDLPDSVRSGQRLTGMTSAQATFPDRAVACSSSPSTGRAGRG